MPAMQEQWQAVVGDITFDDFSAHALAVYLGFEELVNLVAGAIEFCLLFKLTCDELFITRLRVGIAVFFQDVVDSGVDLGFFLF